MNDLQKRRINQVYKKMSEVLNEYDFLCNDLFKSKNDDFISICNKHQNGFDYLEDKKNNDNKWVDYFSEEIRVINGKMESEQIDLTIIEGRMNNISSKVCSMQNDIRDIKEAVLKLQA